MQKKGFEKRKKIKKEGGREGLRENLARSTSSKHVMHMLRMPYLKCHVDYFFKQINYLENLLMGSILSYIIL